MTCEQCGGSEEYPCECNAPSDLLGFLADFRSATRVEKVPTPAPADPGPNYSPPSTAIAPTSRFAVQPAFPVPSPVDGSRVSSVATESPPDAEWSRPDGPPPTPPSGWENPAWAPPVTGPIPAAERDLAGATQMLGIMTLLAPPLAVAAFVTGLMAVVRGVVRPGLPGVARAFRGLLTAMILAPVTVIGLGTVWAGQAASVADFGSGTQIHSVPLVAPGGGYSVIASYTGSDRDTSGPSTLPASYTVYDGVRNPEKVVVVSNQVSTTTWQRANPPARQVTVALLAPTSALAAQLYAQMVGQWSSHAVARFAVGGLRGAQGFEGRVDGSTTMDSVLVERGAVVLAVSVSEPDRTVARVEAQRRAAAQYRAVPAALVRFDGTGGTKEHRHNLVHTTGVEMVAADLGVLGLAVLLVAGGLLIRASRRLG